MKENFDLCLSYVLGHEGGYSDHPNDAGGKTNHGVIQSVYDSYRRRKGLIPRHVQQITMGEIKEIYKTLYWDKIVGDELPAGIDYCVFDAAVNSGPSRGARWLQQAINIRAGAARLKVDENVGPSTLDASDDYDAIGLIDAMLDLRVGFMRTAKNTKTGAALWPSFGRGWTNRLYGYLRPGAAEAARQADGVDDKAKALARKAVRGTSPVAPDAVKAPGLPVPYKYPIPETPKQPQNGAPGWVIALIAAIAAILGVVQWQH